MCKRIVVHSLEFKVEQSRLRSVMADANVVTDPIAHSAGLPDNVETENMKTCNSLLEAATLQI